MPERDGFCCDHPHNGSCEDQLRVAPIKPGDSVTVKSRAGSGSCAWIFRAGKAARRVEPRVDTRPFRDGIVSEGAFFSFCRRPALGSRPLTGLREHVFRHAGQQAVGAFQAAGKEGNRPLGMFPRAGYAARAWRKRRKKGDKREEKYFRPKRNGGFL